MLDETAFVQACRAALRDENPARIVQELLSQALANLPSVANVLSAKDSPMVEFLYRSEHLTVANMRTVPGSVSPIHNHRMWAVIGMYAGQEDNHLYQRETDGKLRKMALKSLRPGDIFNMGPELIHAIGNPLQELNGALHVYGGDLQEHPGRSLWDPQTGQELPYDFQRLLAFTKRMNPGASASP